MDARARRWGKFVLRWGIAVGGIWWVVAHMSLRDRVTILDASDLPTSAILAARAPETAGRFEIIDPADGQPRAILRSQTINPAGKKPPTLEIPAQEGTYSAQIRGYDLGDDLKTIRRVLVTDPSGRRGLWIAPPPNLRVDIPHPRVDVGLITLAATAEARLLWGSILVFPIVFFITAYRWRELLKALDIHLPQPRVFVLNMVGAFYNTFMPGSTGGDVLKAYYVAQQTHHRTQAVMSVIIDRVIGLLGLVILGGVMAAYAAAVSPSQNDPATRACRQVALGAVVIIIAVVSGLAVFGTTRLRIRLGLDLLLRRLPLQNQVQHAIGVMRVYRSRPGLVLWALFVTFPVHITVVLSAMLAGKAFGLPIPTLYYFVAVPVIVLAGALPISPQGAGVMEFFAIQLTRQHAVTVSQAFALTMSIRMVQILWNLTGGLFVLRGGYHAVAKSEFRSANDESITNDEIRMT